MRIFLKLSLVLLALFPGLALACACGCGVFTVGTSALLPTGTGGTAYLEYGYLDQDQNWSGTSSAPAADNDDKEVDTRFYTLGAQYQFDRSWGLSLAVPYLDRTVVAADGGAPETFQRSGLGDVRVLGKYTGFSADMSTGLMAGLKLPTGHYTDPDLERDLGLGTGTTDLILGAYHLGALDAAAEWTWFVNGQWGHALAERAGYRPGDELAATLGTYYSGWEIGRSGSLVPVFQALWTDRDHDRGVLGDSANTGYQKVLFAPGLEYDNGPLRLYAEVEFAAWQDVTGNQLTARRQYKLIASYRF
ncbi:MAG TPA: hypothetical protein VF651_07175 [Gammaproteobacteria bacterium]